MARAWFGGTSNDWPFVEVEAFGATLIALNEGTATGTCWDAKVGGTQWTDLLDVNDNPITSFTVVGPDWPEIQGPDNVMGMWFDFGAGRFYVQARDQAAAAAASATAAAASETNAATSATAAAASAQTAHDISNIDTSDGVVSALVPASSGSATSTALKATYVTPAAKSSGLTAAPLPFVNVRDFGAVGDGMTDDLAAFVAALGVFGTAGGTLMIPAGHYILSDSLTIDAEWIRVQCDPTAIIEMTSTASTGGQAVGFIGHNGAGTATTPQREYCEWIGGTIISPLAGVNENALAAVRYKRVRVKNLNVSTAGRKAFTTQYGCNDVQVDGLTVGQTGNAAVSIEESCDFVGLANVSIDDAGRWGFYIVDATKVSMSRTLVKASGDRAYFFSGCSDVHVDRFTVSAANGHGVEIQDGSGLFSFSRFNMAGIASGFRGFYVHDNTATFAGELEIDKGTVDGAGCCNITATSAKRVALAGVVGRNVPAGVDIFAFNSLTVRPTLHRCRTEGTAHAYTINAVSMNTHEPVVVACDLSTGTSGKYGGYRPKSDVIANGIGGLATLDWPSISAGSTSERTFPATGAAVTDSVLAAPVSGAIEAGLVWSAYVSAAGVVTIRLANVTSAAIDPISQQWRVTVLAPS